MGSVFRRKGSRFWWLAFYDAGGKRLYLSAESEDEKVARKLLSKLERRVAMEKETDPAKRPWTVERFMVERFLPSRRARELATVDRDESMLRHALHHVGHMRLVDVKTPDVLAMMRSLEARKELAPRTLLAIHATLKLLFEDAMAADLVDRNPCILRHRRGELPAKVDKDPNWRRGAVYTREETEALLSSPLIPQWRRVLWALTFLTGSRINEVTPRRWRDYDATAKPLGRIVLSTSWDIRRKREKPATKTGITREVPVHPTLAKVLASWRLSGWEKYVGRTPTAEDLIVPSPYDRKSGDPAGDFLNSNASLRGLKKDCARLGFRDRDQHSMRRTFISLAIVDGANPAITERVTHSGNARVFDLYKVLPWSALCAEVAKLRLVIRKGEVVEMTPATALRHALGEG